MPDSPSTLRMLGQLSSVGMSFVLALVMGFGGGYWLDGQLGTSPWLSFIGFFLGLSAGVLNVYRVMQATASRPSREPGPGAARPEAGSDERDGRGQPPGQGPP
jgi:F0F1-type ATP synthase assembly protein I